MAATSSRVGGIVAPFCAQLDHIFPDLNLIILGTVSLLAGILTFKGKLFIVNHLPRNTVDFL